VARDFAGLTAEDWALRSGNGPMLRLLRTSAAKH
jgi:hypothetical protein